MSQVRIEPAGLEVWKQLSCFHYRQHAPGIIDKVFAVRLANRGGSLCWSRHDGAIAPAVGVIVYAMPMANVSLRNIATGNRYIGWANKADALRLLNREVRRISRVVIRPEFRGIGLGRYLVAQTLALAGTIFVESLAMMGHVNPFFEQAGMARYDAALSPASVRIIAAFARLHIAEEQLAEPVSLRQNIERLSSARRGWLIAEMKKFCRTYVNNNKVNAADELNTYVDIVSGYVFSRPVYYLWRRPNITEEGN